MNLFKKHSPISFSNSKKATATNSLLYTYFLTHDEITRDKLAELGVADISKKVTHINEQGRFYLEEIDGGYVIFKEEKLPLTKKEIEDYNIKIRPRGKRLLGRKRG